MFLAAGIVLQRFRIQTDLQKPNRPLRISELKNMKIRRRIQF